MLAGWIASGRMRKSPAVIHSRVDRLAQLLRGEHPAAARAAGSASARRRSRLSAGSLIDAMMLHPAAARRAGDQAANCGARDWTLDPCCNRGPTTKGT